MLTNCFIKQATTALAAGVLSLNMAYVTAGEDGDSDHDYRTFHADGKIDLAKPEDSYTADLVIYVAGNQYMVMEDLIKDFLKKHKKIKTVYVETIPPGQILKEHILKQGEVKGKKTAQNPDIYGSVNLEHLSTLKGKDLMDKYVTYSHNRLELMIAQGNPKKIKGVKDLGRDDLVQSHPNPINEGIFKFYGKEMLQDLGLYEKVTGGKECKGCWAVEGKTWFTERHHRETPDRIEKGEADVGIVWTSEVLEAKREKRKIDGIAIEDPYNKRDKAAYAMGKLKTARNPANADAFLKYIGTKDPQNIYAKYGFVKATKDETVLKDIPDPKPEKKEGGDKKPEEKK